MIMELKNEFQSANRLRSQIYAASREEMLSKAIDLTLRTPAQHRAEIFEVLMREVVAITSEPEFEMKPWIYFVHDGTDGSRIFRGGVGTSLVVDKQGRLWRARTYEDFETTYTITAKSCEIATMKPNYILMREYILR